MMNRNLWQAVRALLNQIEETEPVWADFRGLHTATGDHGIIWDSDTETWVMYVNVKGALVDQLL